MIFSIVDDEVGIQWWLRRWRHRCQTILNARKILFSAVELCYPDVAIAVFRSESRPSDFP